MKPKVKVNQFEVLHLIHPEGHSILVYALGEDGILYELAGGKWAAFPIKEGMMRDPYAGRQKPEETPE